MECTGTVRSFAAETRRFVATARSLRSSRRHSPLNPLYRWRVDISASSYDEAFNSARRMLEESVREWSQWDCFGTPGERWWSGVAIDLWAADEAPPDGPDYRFEDPATTDRCPLCLCRLYRTAAPMAHAVR